MANQGLNSGVIIPLGKMGVRITPALSQCEAFNRANMLSGNYDAVG